MNLKVYNKNNQLLCEIKEYQYSHSHMDIAKITTSYFSQNNIDFEIGSYVIYKNEKFVIYDKVSGYKTAKTNIGIGDALKFDLEFFAPIKIFETIIFQDYVTEDDTQQYYTGSTNFNFFNNVIELANRLKANIDRFIGNNTWNITVSSDVLLEGKQVSVSNNTLWEGLELVKSVFNLDFYIYGNNIIIGGEGEKIENINLKYGKNNGLYEINRIFEKSQKVVTRLKVYGSERNLPQDYLRDENAKGRYFKNLMLPDFAITGIDYVDAPPEIINEFGIREGVKIFDDIYPSIEEVDLGQGRIDEIVSVDTIDIESDYFTIHVRDLGFEINDYLTADTPVLSIKGDNADGSPTYLGGYEFEIIPSGTSGTVIKLLKNNADGITLPDNITTIRSGDRFVLLGIKMPDEYITNAENKLKQKAEEYFTGEESIELSYPVKLDPKYIYKNNLEDILQTSKKIKITDEDLNVDNYFTIQELTIKYGGVLPDYDIKLSNIKANSLKGLLKNNEVKQNNTNTKISNVTNNMKVNNNIIIGGIETDITWK